MQGLLPLYLVKAASALLLTLGELYAATRLDPTKERLKRYFVVTRPARLLFPPLSLRNAGLAAAVAALVSTCALPANATTYYLSATGADTNNGTSIGSPWLTPKHPLNCGDTILASASTGYSYTSFGHGQWGTVTCPGNNNVAWLKCITFDACKVVVPNGVKAFAVDVSSNYWGVQGFEASNLQTDFENSLGCFNAEPNGSPLHHVVFANNVAITCPLSGFGGGLSFDGNSANNALSVDYYVAVGNIAYGGGNNASCGSNIGLYMPIAADTQPGTHIYIAGNFSIAATNQPGCWDGNGIILDTFDNANVAGVPPFGQQVVVDNNISIGNGGVGIRLEYNDKLAPGVTGFGFTPQIARRNTAWGNNQGAYASGSPDCGEIQLFNTANTAVYSNLAVTSTAACYGFEWSPLAAVQVKDSDSSDSVYSNWTWSPFGVGNQIATDNRDNAAGSPFTYGSNTTNTDPLLTAPTVPSSPVCSGFASAPACMAEVIHNFKPRVLAAQAYGYQVPSLTSVYDPLFPQWVCNVNLPIGLVTMGCGVQASVHGWSMKGIALQ